MRIRGTIALVLGMLFVVAIGRLARLDGGGPSHASVELPGRIPATLYLPSGEGNPFFRTFAPPPAERPPAVVLVHGFMSDRQMMSVLARRIAANGYAVLAIDVHGHGENRNPFMSDFTTDSSLNQDVRQAVAFLRSDPFVDGSRIVVMGHSMGAGAVLGYATQDTALKGAVMISGGFRLSGPERPANALFIFAQHDPERIHSSSMALVAHLAGVPAAELAQRYGDFDRGTAVEAARVPDVDHLQILYSAAAAQTIVQWLDGTCGVQRSGSIEVAEPRLRASGVALVLFVLLLVPIGRACGALAGPRSAQPAGPSGWIGVAVVAAALSAATPLVAMIPVASFVPLAVGDVQLSWFGVAGLLLMVGVVLARQLDWRGTRAGLPATLGAAALAFALIYVCIVPLSVAFHRLSFTPERFVVFIVATAILLPFWAGFERLVRRGGLVASTALAVIGRAVSLALIAVGVSLNVLPFVMILVLPSLVVISVMIEIFAASAYSTSHNRLAIALVEAAWFAWLIAATNPITLMF